MLNVYVRKTVIASFYVVQRTSGGDHKAVKLDSQVCVRVCCNDHLYIVD